jgi:hypothetical protein
MPMEMDTTDLIARARAGDHDAFRDLVQGHSRELQVHCYRILGSLQDAEDALQETLVSAWRNLGEFGQRSSLRTWLYKIATNRCLSMLRADSRRLRCGSLAAQPARREGRLPSGGSWNALVGPINPCPSLRSSGALFGLVGPRRYELPSPSPPENAGSPPGQRGQ